MAAMEEEDRELEMETEEQIPWHQDKVWGFEVLNQMMGPLLRKETSEKKCLHSQRNVEVGNWEHVWGKAKVFVTRIIYRF